MITKTKPECETKLCYYDSASRPNFFNGMLLTDDHLRAEQEYHREARKRFNRNLFGSGIVCGLQVERQETGLCIKVHPGAAIDCCGNLIEVCKCVTIDLSKECKERYGSDCIPKSPDPAEFEITKFLVLRYVEKETDLEPVLTPDNDCKSASDKPDCQASKIREGYCIELWDNCPCPETYTEPTKDLLAVLLESRPAYPTTTTRPPTGANPTVPTAPPEGTRRDCIDLPLPCSDCGCCESSNAVGLAGLKIDCLNNTVQIVNCPCRRYVISPRMLAWLFSSLQSKNYLPEGFETEYSRMDLVTAHAVATFASLEFNSQEVQKIKPLVERVKALEKKQRILASQQPKPVRTPRSRKPPPTTTPPPGP